MVVRLLPELRAGVPASVFVVATRHLSQAFINKNGLGPLMSM